VSERVFIDTNVLVYADDLDAGAKNATAQGLLRDVLVNGNGVLSTQVLQEFFVVATRKLGVDAETARRKIELLSTLDTVRIEVEQILAAIDLHRLHPISFCDALIITCAATGGCTRVLSEDLQHGRTIGGVTIENPFLLAERT
jgi:predicted nucleic acid-binding protein